MDDKSTVSRQTEYNKKSRQKNNIKRLTIDIKSTENELITMLANDYNLSKKEAIMRCVKYCIDNEIDISI